MINGVGNLAASLAPMLMGAAMASPSGESLARGFWLLVGTQVVTVICGLVLLHRFGVRERSGARPTLGGGAQRPVP